MTYGIFPRVNVKENSKTAENSYFGITIDPKFYQFGAALAEERTEFEFKWRKAAPLMLMLAIAIYFISWPFIPLAFFIPPAILSHLPAFNREVERVGHSVYASTASQCYGITIDKALDECVDDLRNEEIFPYFKNYDREQLRAELVQHLPSANKWVFNHLPIITEDIKRNAN